MALYSLIPFVMIALANFLLVMTVHVRRKRTVNNYTQQITHQNNPSQVGGVVIGETSKQRNERMNQTVLLMTFLFIALTFPIACASFFFDILFATDWGYFIIVFLDCISFSYHGFNFIIMTFSNTMFRKEFFKILVRNRT